MLIITKWWDSVIKYGLSFTTVLDWDQNLNGTHGFPKPQNNIHTIYLNRPDRLNAWTEEMATEIKQSMDNASKNDEVKVIILTGTGRGFCAGADMDSLNTIDADERADKNSESPYSAFDNSWPLDFQRAQTWFPSVPKPIIAAINAILHFMFFCCLTKVFLCYLNPPFHFPVNFGE